MHAWRGRIWVTTLGGLFTFFVCTLVDARPDLSTVIIPDVGHVLQKEIDQYGPADFAQHVMELKKKLPAKGFHIVVPYYPKTHRYRITSHFLEESFPQGLEGNLVRIERVVSTAVVDKLGIAGKKLF